MSAAYERKDSIALINGVIYPMASPGRSGALYAHGGVIKAIGSDREILAMCGARTNVLDMKGKFILPGFTDTHNHLLATGRSLEMLDLSSIRSISAIIKKSKKALAESDMSGRWFFARGWNQDNLSEKRFLTRADLDKVTRDIPMFFERSCGHIAALNTKAMEILNIDRGTMIPGGVISMDENGEPNGVISESAVSWARRKTAKYSEESLERWYKRAVDEMVHLGITSVQTDDIELMGSTKKAFDFYQQMDEEGKMPLRVAQQWQLSDVNELGEFIDGGYHKYAGTYFKSGPLKIRVDGTLGARTAALREEYSDDPGNRGIYRHSREDLLALLRKAQDAGMQVAFYAIGDGAINRCLDVIEEAGPSTGGIRHRIVHCQVGSEDIYQRMGKLGVMADIQPTFVTTDWPIVMQRLGADRARWSYAWKFLLMHGITIGAGSDSPSEMLEPLVGIRAAILRQDMGGKPEYGWMPSQRLDPVEAFAIYTSGGAEVCCEEKWRGTLEVGKAADITAYMEDPIMSSPNDLPAIKAGLTIVDGKIRYIR